MLVGCGELPLEAAPSHASARYGAMRAPFGSRTLASLGDRVEIESVPSGPLAVLCCTRAGPRAARAPRTPRRAVDEQCVCVCGVSCLSVCTKDRRERGSGGGRRRGSRRGVAAEPRVVRGLEACLVGFIGASGEVVHRELHTCATFIEGRNLHDSCEPFFSSRTPPPQSSQSSHRPPTGPSFHDADCHSPPRRAPQRHV